MENQFFKKIGLEKDFSLQLPVEIEAFKASFEREVGRTPAIVGFGRPSTEFQGRLENNTVKIWKSISAYQSNNAATYVTLLPNGDRTNLIGVTKIPQPTLLLSFSLLLAINGLTISATISTGQLQSHPSVIAPILALILIFSMTWWYFWMRRSVTQLSRDVEREFFYWTKEKSLTTQR
ncbi:MULTISPECIES: hypothetical protein [unclassified Imperialibacter]|uniref:hypothetical protein n=1 Tax=unclassified Imperialibacter TaxID=2629706 RepID=UPI00125FB846|nr:MULTISPECIES: hypothetical protein [unclassified Imperialibacter]